MYAARVPPHAAAAAAQQQCPLLCASLPVPPPSDTLLQNMKDSLIVTTAGAEVLPFLAAYAVLPASIAFFVYHSNLVKLIPERWVYAASLAPLLIFYVLFVTVLLPLAPVLHPVHLLESWRSMLPPGIGLIGYAGYMLKRVPSAKKGLVGGRLGC